MNNRIAIAIAIITLLQPASSFAFDKPSRWTSSTSPVFPVVRVRGCPNHFNANFPGFDWNRVAHLARAAANTWFTEGGANLRLRYVGDLPANDARCANGSGAPGSGEILLTAEVAHGGGACNLATTFSWSNGAGELTHAKVILHRGTVCSGTFGNYAWDPGADYPGPGQFDFQSVLLHEFGHAIGFNHSGDPGSIMWPSANTGDNTIRNLAADDVLGLRQASSSYGSIQTVSRHRYTGAASAPSQWSSEGETIPDALLGAPAAVHSPLQDANQFYLVAYTRATDHALMFGRTNGFFNWASGFIPVATRVSSYRPPAVSANTAMARDVIAYADHTNDALTTRYLTSGSSWSQPVSVGSHTRVAPALAFLPRHGVHVIAWAEHPSGRIRTAVSHDNGSSWNNQQVWAQRTFLPFGLTCQRADQCVVAHSNGESPFARIGYFYLRYDAASGYFVAGSNSAADIGADTYGAAIATNTSTGRMQLGWRDRGTATVPASGGWGTNIGVLDTTAYLPVISFAAPRMAYNSSWNEFTLWSNHATRYEPL